MQTGLFLCQDVLTCREKVETSFVLGVFYASHSFLVFHFHLLTKTATLFGNLIFEFQCRKFGVELICGLLRKLLINEYLLQHLIIFLSVSENRLVIQFTN